MRFFTEKPLIDFIEKQPKYRVVLQDWASKVKKCEWENIEDISNDFSNIEFKNNSKVIFHFSLNNTNFDIEIMLIGQFVYVRQIVMNSIYT